MGVAIGVVVAAILAGLTMLRSPARERERRMDDRRVTDLAAIGRAADLHSSRRGELPRDLSELAIEMGSGLSVSDPGGGQSYEYRVVDADTYELCAQFQQPSAPEASVGFWSHKAGRHCFVLNVQKILR